MAIRLRVAIANGCLCRLTEGRETSAIARAGQA
jgi:hypothetical protein